jgi:chlorobactene glucosyltransferase
VSWPWWGGALCAAPYWAGAIGTARIGRLRPRLAEWEPLPEDRSPLVSIIVPARNEAANIARCLASILSSSYPNFEVIVVDDRSSDATGDRARAAAPGDTRLTVIAGAELPQGWFGKTWACWQGYEAAKGELLLFTDADTWHGPMLLPRAVAMLADRRADLVSLLQRQEAHTFWERLVQPLFFGAGGLIFALNGGMVRMNESRDPRKAAANGQFILVTRGSYEAVGGHRRIAGTVVEDLRLAFEYRKAGLRGLLAFTDDDMSTRMYDSFGAIVEGWSKNIFMAGVELLESVPRAYVFSALLLSLPLAALLPLPALVLGLARGNAALIAFGLLGYAGLALTIGLILRAWRTPPLYALCHPLGVAVQAWIVLRAMWRGPGRIEWRGRTYVHGVGERP